MEGREWHFCYIHAFLTIIFELSYNSKFSNSLKTVFELGVGPILFFS